MTKKERRQVIAANFNVDPEPVNKYDPEVAYQNRIRCKPVPDYAMYIHRNEDNLQPKGFNFDADMFENLISCYATYEMIPVMLRTTISKLDEFCRIVYNMPYKETYTFFNYASKLAMNRAFENLAKCGNTTAQSITAKHMLGYKDDSDLNSNVSITFSGLDKDDLNKGGFRVEVKKNDEE